MLSSVVITIAIALAIGSLVAVVGTPIAVRVARPKLWSRGHLPHDHTGPAAAPPPSFQPLDLGPDPMRWPSENPWKKKGQKELPWPSQTWDDPHFGAHWRNHTDGDAADDAYERKQAARRAAVAEARRLEDQRSQQRADSRPAPAPSGTRAQQQARKEMRALRERATQMTQQVQAQIGDPREQLREQAARAAQQARQAAEQEVKRQVQQRAPAASQAMANVPSAAELEQLVAQVGLAGTVQKIMERTGWDFKTAAQHLARARRGR